MKAMSTYPIEYLKVHLAYDEIKTVVRASIFKKTGEAKKYLVASVVIILIGLLFITASIRMSECSNITAYVNDAIPDKVPLQFVL